MVRLHLLDENAPSFAGKVVDILNSTLPLDSAFSPADAAKALNGLYPHSLDTSGDAESKDKAGGFLWWFWDLFHDLARQVPHDSLEQDRLVAIIKELRDLPSKTISLGEWGTVRVWGGLPLLGPTLREKWDSKCCISHPALSVWSTTDLLPVDDDTAPTNSDLKQRFLNLQSYAARITGLRLAPCESYAIWALTDALEGVMTPIRGAPDEVNPDPAAVEDLPFKVVVAAEWIVHAGHVLYGRDEEIYATQGGPLWRLDKTEARRLRRKYKSTQGLCPARWELWKERFGVIRDSNKVGDSTQTVAGGAVDAMERVEREEGS